MPSSANVWDEIFGNPEKQKCKDKGKCKKEENPITKLEKEDLIRDITGGKTEVSPETKAYIDALTASYFGGPAGETTATSKTAPAHKPPTGGFATPIFMPMAGSTVVAGRYQLAQE